MNRTISLQGTGDITIDSDEFDLVCMLVADAGADTEWAKACELIKSIAGQYGTAKAVALVINARRAARESLL